MISFKFHLKYSDSVSALDINQYKLAKSLYLVNENVLAVFVVTRDESVSIFDVEPFYSARYTYGC